MSAIHAKNTVPELTLRKALWAKGLRFRIHYSKEKIDIAFPTKKLAIFVDGCFWHGCPIHSHKITTTEAYWLPKLEKNKERDRNKNEKLCSQGWTVMRIWEHELANIGDTVNRIQKELDKKNT